MDPRDTNEVIRKAGHAWRFFFVMLAIGLARSMAGASVSYRTIVAPLLVSQVAANWVETRCVIVAGQPETEQNRSNSHTSSGTTRVRYKYRYGGIDYVCDSKDLHSPSAAASGAKPAGFSLGAETVCYVNHLNPPESVL